MCAVCDACMDGCHVVCVCCMSGACELQPHLGWVDIRHQLPANAMQAFQGQLLQHNRWGWGFRPIANINAAQQDTLHEVCHRALLSLGNIKVKALPQHLAHALHAVQDVAVHCLRARVSPCNAAACPQGCRGGPLGEQVTMTHTTYAQHKWCAMPPNSTNTRPHC